MKALSIVTRTQAQWIAACAVFVAMTGICITQYRTPLPDPLFIDVALHADASERPEPLITAGQTGSADFLYLRRVGANQVVFGHDSWGFPGQESRPVQFEFLKPHRLEISFPAATQRSWDERFTALIRLRCDGVTVLETQSQFFDHVADDVRFAENPAGGITGPQLHGEIHDMAGRRIHGAMRLSESRSQHLVSWLRHKPHQLFIIILLTVLIAWPNRKSQESRKSPTTQSVESPSAFRQLVYSHRHFIGVVCVSSLVVFWTITYGTGRLIHPEPFSAFYDYQAASLLQGRLDVPLRAIAGEAFIYEGKYYGYFGPTPALLRIPFVLFDVAFGQLSRALMLGYLIGSLTATYLILRQAFRLIGRTDSRPSGWGTTCFLTNVGLGSTLFFLCGRAFMFHEAILCGITFALFSIWCTLRYYGAPERRWWIGALGCALASIHARPTTGLFAFTFLALIAGVVAVRAWRYRPHSSGRTAHVTRSLTIAGLCAVGVFSFNGLSYLKFKNFEGAPLRYSQPYNAERLAHIDGKAFHQVNIPYGFYSYVLYPNFRFETRFPYFVIGSRTGPRDFPKAKIDLPDTMLGWPYSMPALSLLAVFGCALALWKRQPGSLVSIAAWIAVLPMAVALFAAVATAQRYTGDFCPFLIAAAAFGIVAVQQAMGVIGKLLRTVFAMLTLASILITAAITFDYQGGWAPNMPQEVQMRYQAMARRIDQLVGSLHR